MRLALGASPARLVRLVVAQGMLPVGLGLALGAVLALASGRLIASMLYRVSPFDPCGLGGAGFVLTAFALLACYLPARHVARVDPSATLRAK